jgi:hypothetical protein
VVTVIAKKYSDVLRCYKTAIKIPNVNIINFFPCKLGVSQVLFFINSLRFSLIFVGKVGAYQSGAPERTVI